MYPALDLRSAALLVLDWQLFFVSPESPACVRGAAGAEGNVLALVEAFARAGNGVIATRHGHPRKYEGSFLDFYGRLLDEDDPLAELAPSLRDRTGIRVVRKSTYSAFSVPDLARDLRSGRTDSLVLAGVQTDKCVAASALAAFDLGFRVAVVRNACAARTRERHEGALRLLERSCALIVTARDLCGALS